LKKLQLSIALILSFMLVSTRPDGAENDEKLLRQIEYGVNVQ
jgi:hypothetical protein